MVVAMVASPRYFPQSCTTRLKVTEPDTAVRNDVAWAHAAVAYTETKRQADELGERQEAARQALLALAQHPKETGGGCAWAYV